MKKKIVDNPSIVKARDTIQAFDLLEKLSKLAPEIKGLFSGSDDLFVRARDLNKPLEAMSILDQFNERFTSRGWIAYESMSLEVMAGALDVEKESGIDAAERVLVNYYDGGIIELGIFRFGGHPVFYKRTRLVRLAKIDYIAERYHACIPLLLALLDGIANDILTQFGFFAEGADLTSFDAIAGHETGLTALASVLKTSRTKTNESEITIPYRHGILHGRELAFDNRLVAAKCWAAIFAVRDWAETIGNRPAESEDFDWVKFLERRNGIERQKKALRDWKARGADDLPHLPASGPASLLPNGTPERALAEFLDNWIRGNFGNMAIALMDNLSKSVKVRAGEVRKLFHPHKLTGYDIVRLEDAGASMSTVEVELKIREGETIRSLPIRVRLICFSNGGSVIRSSELDEWRIYEDGFCKLKNIVGS